jgi:large conductance mechanosensitive channel
LIPHFALAGSSLPSNFDREDQTMGMIKEFKEFAMRGNVVDLAVGIIIGAAFGGIVSSLVNDVIMPPVGKLMGNVNFSDLFLSLDPEKTKDITSLAQAKEAGAAVIAYGSFINTVINFVIVAFCVFLLVKAMNRMKTPQKAGPATTKECPFCLSTIPLKASRCPHCTSEIK